MNKNKIKKESELKKKIKELKSTSRGKAILRLIKWAIFFFFLFLFLIISAIITKTRPAVSPTITNKPDTPIKEDTSNESKPKSLSELATNLLKSTYDYNYEITISEDKYIYNGHKTLDFDTGYKETNDGIIKYYIDNTGTFKETTTEKIPLDNLYENLNIEYLTLESIFETFAKLEFTLNKEHDCQNDLYMASDNLNNYEYETNGEEILFIKIYNQDYNYYLSFSEVKEVI